MWGGHEASHFPWVPATTSMMVHLMHLLDVMFVVFKGDRKAL